MKACRLKMECKNCPWKPMDSKWCRRYINLMVGLEADLYYLDTTPADEQHP